jgi:hypothetical protein
VATGWLANNDPGFPGYFGDIPLDAPTIARSRRTSGQWPPDFIFCKASSKIAAR